MRDYRSGLNRIILAACVAGVLVLTLAGPATAARPKTNLAGVQVWNVPYWDTVNIGDYYGPNYKILKLEPIALAGARNGTFSGQVVLTNSNGPLRNLKAHVTEMATEDGDKLPASAVQVRYAKRADDKHSFAPTFRFDGLVTEAPEEVPTIHPSKIRRYKPKNIGPVAMQPVWVSISVPKDAKPGLYKGDLVLEMETPGLMPMTVPVEINIADFTLPDPADYKVQNLAYMSPEAVANWYEVELWSDRHFDLMGNSFELMLKTGSRQVILDLVARYPARDNEQGILRWIKQEDGTYTYDFSKIERYLDLAASKVGKPFPVRLNILFARKNHLQQAGMITIIDAKTGEMSFMTQPEYGSDEWIKLWKPPLDQLRERLEKRGWYERTVVNWINYCGTPEKEIVDGMLKIWPDAKFASMDHGRRRHFDSSSGQVPVPVSLTVWNQGSHRAYYEWDKKSPGPFGWSTKTFGDPLTSVATHARGQHREYSPLWIPRLLTENMIMRGETGVDPIGADLFPQRSRRGDYRKGNWTAYALGPGNATSAYLWPGENGAVATPRYEALREGVQIAEAMIYLQHAISEGKIDGKLAEAAHKALDDRARHYINSTVETEKGRWAMNVAAYAEGARDLDMQLFEACAKVAAAIGDKPAKQ